MNGTDTLRSAFQAAYVWFDGTVADVTDEQSRHRPPGAAHPIGALVAHIHQAEDWTIQQLGKGEQPLWESGEWEQKLDIPNVMQLTEGCHVNREACVETLQPYTNAVRANTKAFLDGLSDADLDRKIDLSALGMDPMRLGDALIGFAVSNTLAHTGEISAIKGTLGARGYPF